MLKTTTRDKSSDFSVLVFNPFHHADEEDDYNQIEYRWVFWHDFSAIVTFIVVWISVFHFESAEHRVLGGVYERRVKSL